MPPDQRALIGPDGRVLGQVLACRSFMITPLHVMDPDVPVSISCVDRHGKIKTVVLSEVAAVDPPWDVIMFRMLPPSRSECSLRVPSVGRAGIAVAVHAIVDTNREDGHIDRLVVFRSTIRELLDVHCHHYRSASGRMVRLKNIRALFLAHPFPPGWSGAPVYVTRTGELAGFIHGNSPANAGDGVCLVPDAASSVVQMLNSADKAS